MVSPSFDENLIRASLSEQWEGKEDFYLLLYPSLRSGRGVNNPVTAFVLSFKEGGKVARAIAETVALQGFQKIEKRLRDEFQCKYIVCVPGHNKGFASFASEELCKSLARTFGWLTHLPRALERTETVPKAAYARARGRPAPGYSEHLRTICYRDSPLRKDGGFILFDDVLTRANTSRACRDIIRNATKCKTVIGFFLARTQW